MQQDSHTSPEIDFVSLWIPVIDEIRFGNGRVVTDLLGGSGTFGMSRHASVERYFD